MKLSFVATVLNEDRNIEKLITSLFSQTKLPDEIIIVDGGSRDQTVAKIKYQISKIKNKFKNLKFKIIIKKGNIPAGRNEGIRRATGDIVLSSDAGCLLDKNWVKNITSPFRDPKVDVVAGYYRGLPKNIFQKCLVPYVLVMEDRVKPDEFLPATRSMAFKKKVWEKLGGFREDLDASEDFDFARKIKKNGFKIAFSRNAVAYWIPRDNLWQAFIMFFRFAKEDIGAEIIRPKVFFIFLRYIIALYLFLLSIAISSTALYSLTGILVVFYILWSIMKNYKYIKHPMAVLYLPILQIASDFSVMLGTTIGFFKAI